MTIAPAQPDLASASREDLIASHVIHTFDEALVRQNLRGCYGALVDRFYRRLLPLLGGRRVIDCGCGFGLFARLARQAGHDVHAIDIDEASLAVAREVCQVECRRESVYETSLPDGSRDVAVCFDSIEHMDLPRLGLELRRLGVRQVLVYESNERNPLLRWYRRLAGHEEAHDYPLEQVLEAFAAEGFRCRLRRYENFLSLPLSGGLQRRPLPLLGRAPALIWLGERALEPLLQPTGLAGWLGFRYLLVLERDA